jgi:hypothetical protein
MNSYASHQQRMATGGKLGGFNAIGVAYLIS